ncbi:ADP-ribose pyrophosphatase YjhB, NUDIX family [Streptoalloteichus hindustanus]|uniref:ADP-ribose pyrophosphatase YjhB, NUDIX family n=1 Tax=Streptoalloteichus hindustanus TaxID=2017 RepID=A0A1M5J3B2_STRHI|nr:ADP-ribose pyrophosphatase YjhB, NUDIX family [Streptoalloteichus hindustanus]
MIRTVGLLHVVGRRLLVVRPRGKGAFYLPGGKLEPGEAEPDALRREVREELGVELAPDSVRPARRYLGPAYGEGDGVLVDLSCYTAEVVGEPHPSAEVAELALVTEDEYLAHPETAPVIVELLRDLRGAGQVA